MFLVPIYTMGINVEDPLISNGVFSNVSPLAPTKQFHLPVSGW